MTSRERIRHGFEPAETDRIIAKAKQKRAEALRRMFGTVLGR